MTSTRVQLRELAGKLFTDSLSDCSIEHAFATLKSYSNEQGRRLVIGATEIDLSRIRRIRVIAAGKAATPMLLGLLPHVKDLPGCDLAGILIAKDVPGELPVNFQSFAGGHPLPTQASFDGARAALAMVTSAQRGAAPSGTLCLFLLSGGGSAMMELPLDPEISLEDTVSFYRELVHSGAAIAEINCVRKHFSAIKGGRLALACGEMPSVSLLISDVPQGHLDALASGPTLPDTSTVEQCRAILERYGMLKRFPPSVRRFFQASSLEETPKLPQANAHAVTLLTSDDMAFSAKQRAEMLGFYAVVDNTCDDWDYRRAASYLLERLRLLRREHKRVCLISSGEVTVELPEHDGVENGAHGTGGRNQHFVLYIATLLDAGTDGIAVLSAGTDGIDGNSLAAGAVVDGRTLAPAEVDEAGLPSGRSEAEEALRRFDSGRFLDRVGASIMTGPTGNNLRDLRILLAE